MTAVWSSPRDEFPQSVHALMALWGNFDPPSGANDCGIEKRLQLDFRCRFVPNVLSVADLASVMEHVGESLEASVLAENIIALRFRRSLLVISDRQVILTSASSVLLHATLRPLLELLSAHGVDVEWASFMRMDTRSPWTAMREMSDVMAQEYAAFKSAFPSGNAFMTGPVDEEHFFYFIYDGINRSEFDREEKDIQINVYMTNCNVANCASDGTTKSVQFVTPLGSASYETLRITSDSNKGLFASFETNVLRGGRLQELLLEYSPDRVTLMVLEDRHCSPVMLRNLLEQVKDYTVLKTMSNHFAEGYAYHQFVLIRES